MKRWKVTTTYIPALAVFAICGGYRGPPFWPKPRVTVKLYRWRWLARMRVLADNSYNAFNPASVFGFIRSELSVV